MQVCTIPPEISQAGNLIAICIIGLTLLAVFMIAGDGKSRKDTDFY